MGAVAVAPNAMLGPLERLDRARSVVLVSIPTRRAPLVAWHVLLERSARAYDRGQVPEAQRIAQRSRELFSRAAKTWNEPEFEELADQASADEGAYQTLSPGSAAGRRQVKEVKARAQSALLR